MDWKGDMMRSDAARLLPKRARELIAHAERMFQEVKAEILNGSPITRRKAGLRSFDDSKAD
jgi:hypothetical protein